VSGKEDDIDSKGVQRKFVEKSCGNF